MNRNIIKQKARLLLRPKTRRQKQPAQKVDDCPAFQDMFHRLQFERLQMEIYQQRTALHLTKKNDEQAQRFVV